MKVRWNDKNFRLEIFEIPKRSPTTKCSIISLSWSRSTNHASSDSKHWYFIDLIYLQTDKHQKSIRLSRDYTANGYRVTNGYWVSSTTLTVTVRVTEFDGQQNEWNTVLFFNDVPNRASDIDSDEIQSKGTFIRIWKVSENHKPSFWWVYGVRKYPAK